MRRVRSLALLLAALLLVVPPPGAAASPGDEQHFLAAVNASRGSAGQPALRSMPDLVAIARQQAADMASQGRLYHRPGLGDEVQGWRSLGENVGRGTSVAHVHQLMMESTAHRANILSGRFQEVGIGVVWSGSQLYVSEVFREPMQQASPPPTTSPPPTSAPPPRPSATAAPTTVPPATTVPPTTMAPPPTTASTTTTSVAEPEPVMAAMADTAVEGAASTADGDGEPAPDDERALAPVGGGAGASGPWVLVAITLLAGVVSAFVVLGWSGRLVVRPPAARRTTPG